MTKEARIAAIEKIAYIGGGYDPEGYCTYRTPPPTVGQFMYNVNGPYSPLSSFEKRKITDRVVDTGIDVNSPAKSLLRAGIGALAGNFLANAFGAGPFMRGVATTIGANYGYNN